MLGKVLVQGVIVIGVRWSQGTAIALIGTYLYTEMSKRHKGTHRSRPV